MGGHFAAVAPNHEGGMAGDGVMGVGQGVVEGVEENFEGRRGYERCGEGRRGLVWLVHVLGDCSEFEVEVGDGLLSC